MRSPVAAIVLAIAFAPCASAHPESHPARQPPGVAAVATPVPATSSAPAAAHFGASTRLGGKRGPNKTDWYFLRQPNRIETIRPSGGIAEIWVRDERRGDLSLKRVFHSDRRVVEYAAGDLRAMGIATPWTTLGSIIDPRILAQQLKRTGTVRIPQGTATVYKGTLGGQNVEVWWLEQASLPARIIRESDDRLFTLTLKALHPSPPSSWPRIDDAALASYLVIDAADLGDRHGDPFVQKVERFDAETHAFGRAASTHSR